jgi:hypothetical protein
VHPATNGGGVREDGSSKQRSLEKKMRQGKLVESKTSPATPSHLLAAPGVPSKPNHLEAPLEKTKPAQPSEAAQVCLFFEFFFSNIQIF